jgi:hypothetical protein
MRGVYLVASELSRLGFIASTTSRSAVGADILVTDQSCRRAFSVQVKTNARTFDFWLLGKKAKDIVSDTHIYIFVNLRKRDPLIEYFVVPSAVVAEKMTISDSPKATWYSFWYMDAEACRDQWELFGDPLG